MTWEFVDRLRGIVRGKLVLKTGEDAKEWLDRIQPEHDNIRAALAWSLEEDPEVTLRLASSLRLFWEVRGHFSEGFRWLEEALPRAAGAAPEVRMRALSASGTIAFRLGKVEVSEERWEEALEIARELIPTAKALGLGILPYFPLASGLLTGKYKRGAALPPGSRLAKNPRHAKEFINARNWRIVGELETFAARRDHTMLELAFSWLLRDGVVASATTPEQVEQNVRAAGWTLSAEDLAEIDRITL